MDSADHIIDPRGDTLITLHDAGSQFAACAYDGVTPDSATTTEDYSKHASPQITFQVSSKALMLASPYFVKMFEGPWNEASKQSRNGIAYNVRAEGWDEGAFLAVLNIFHLRTRPVAPQINVEEAAKFASIVDYYACYEAVEPFWRCWEPKLPLWWTFVSHREMLLRLLVAWVFKEESVFEALTRALLRQHTGPLKTFGLPLPSNFAERFEHTRRTMVQGILAKISSALTHYRQSNICTIHCRSLRLGKLQFQLQESNLLDESGLIAEPGACSLHDLEVFLKSLEVIRCGDNQGRWQQGLAVESQYPYTMILCKAAELWPCPEMVNQSMSALRLTDFFHPDSGDNVQTRML